MADHSGRELGPSIQTLLGPVAAPELGTVLVHEHLVVDHARALGLPGTPVDAATYRLVRDRLRRARSHGVRTIVDCTPPGYGRYLDLMAEVSAETDVQIIASTGSFCASWGPLLPEVLALPVEGLVDLFRREIEEGAGSTRWRAGAIKAATSAAITDGERKVLQAAGHAAAVTGAPIVSHTSGTEGLEQLDIYAETGVELSRILISHLGLQPDPLEYALAVAARGAWVGLDKIGRPSLATDRHWIELILGMHDAGRLAQVLLSHDVVVRFSGPPHVAAETFDDYSYITRVFCPKLRAAGLSEHDIRELLIANPARWLIPGECPNAP